MLLQRERRWGIIVICYNYYNTETTSLLRLLCVEERLRGGGGGNTNPEAEMDNVGQCANVSSQGETENET